MPNKKLANIALVSALVLLAACSNTAIKPAAKHTVTPPRPLNADDLVDAQVRWEIPTAAGNRSPYVIYGRSYQVLASAQGYSAQGVASWYGPNFHGRPTSNGEQFDMYQMTAAHKTLPIPCYLRVTAVATGKQVVVRVNDRGPFHDDRLVDLSYAAATKLGIVDAGTALVNIEVLQASAVENEAKQLVLQVGAFEDQIRAEQLQSILAGLMTVPVYIDVQNGGSGGTTTLHRVKVGPIASADEAERLQQLIIQQQLGLPMAIPSMRAKP